MSILIINSIAGIMVGYSIGFFVARYIYKSKNWPN